jgi:hypothetical protein
MKFYSQKNYSDKLGTCGETIKSAGCFLVSLSMLVDIDPTDANRLLSANGGYSGGCKDMINSVNAAEILELDFMGISFKDPKRSCIAETDHFKEKGTPQHFFVWLGNGLINDPLLPYGNTVNNYNIVSYRLFSRKDETMKLSDQQVKDMARNIVYEVYKGLLHEPTEKEIEDSANWIIADSGDSFNFKGAGEWLKGVFGSIEFNNKWMKKIDCQKSIDEMYLLKEICVKSLTECKKNCKDSNPLPPPVEITPETPPTPPQSQKKGILATIWAGIKKVLKEIWWGK